MISYLMCNSLLTSSPMEHGTWNFEHRTLNMEPKLKNPANLPSQFYYPLELPHLF